MKNILYLLFSLIFLINATQNASASIHYVKQGSNGNGSDWQNASGDLQLQIEYANFGDTIWVSEGTYRPFRPWDSLTIIDVTNRKDAFVLKKSLKIFGSFPTSGNPGYDDRDFNLYPSIINGDIGVQNDNSDNCLHLVLCLNDSTETLLDGFVLKNGNATNSGAGGVLVSYSTPTFKNLTIDSCISSGGGGGMRLYYSSVKVQNVDFLNLKALSGSGGAIYLEQSDILLEKVNFINNTAIYVVNSGSIGSGGAIYSFNSSTTIHDGFFKNNSSSVEKGGAICNRVCPNRIIEYTNVIFEENTGSVGGAIYNLLAHSVITNCLFVKNIATSNASWGWGGGAIMYDNEGGDVTNCTFYGNLAYNGGGICTHAVWPKPTIRNCIFDKNIAIDPMRTATGDIAIENPIIYNSFVQPFTILAYNFNGAQGIITGDAGFKDTANGDFRLKCNSVGVDGGNDSFYLSGITPDLSNITTDLQGNPRFSKSHVDMGAYEYLFEGDTINMEVCNGESYTHNNRVYYAPYLGYLDTFSNMENCDSFTVLNLIEVNIDTSLSFHQDTLFANQNNAFYQWYDCNSGIEIPGETNQFLKLNAPGKYKVKIVFNDCIEFSSCYNYNGTAINNVSKDFLEIKAFPNPVSEACMIKINGKMGINPSITIFDITGKLIKTESITGSGFILNMSQMSSGLYLVRYLDDRHTFNIRLNKL